MGEFNYSLGHNPAALNIGQDIDVEVVVKDGSSAKISDVKVSLDGFQLNSGESTVSPAASHFQASFGPVGNFTPGSKHKLEVTVKPQQGDVDHATVKWTD